MDPRKIVARGVIKVAVFQLLKRSDENEWRFAKSSSIAVVPARDFDK
jgi:hypothetical protein